MTPKKIVEWEQELFGVNLVKAFENPADSKKELKKLETDNERLLKKVGADDNVECNFFLRKPVRMPD